MEEKTERQQKRYDNALLRDNINQIDRVIDRLNTNLERIADTLSGISVRLAVFEARQSDILDKDEKTDDTIDQLKKAVAALEKMAHTDAEKIRRNDQQFIDAKKAFVTKEQFTPIQKIVYGVIAFLFTSVVGTIVSQLIKK